MQSVSLDHKQIAYVTFDPSDDVLIIHYHKGEYKSVSPVLFEEFESLASADNKVDVLCSIMMRKGV
ncbi:hypothetical protein [Paenibacillus thermotolerans]|uniref:hypothetical protein n=1 Tax=Paenibacillus thermotolerans TaxID=3027807 RepID=UPI002368B439|nr:MULTISPECIES: hypothetical protein [unclassified Paenibacillus]